MTPSKIYFLSMIFFSCLVALTPIEAKAAKLSPNYYKKSCPQFSSIMEQVIATKQIASPTTAAAVLRLFFHDCMVDGCDGSTLVASNSYNTAERDAEINHSLPGDAFDLVTRAKTALELSCPGVVSCTDILAVAARNLVIMVGGPYYPVSLGRKDGLVSKASRVEGNIAKPTMHLTKIIKMFAAKGFTVQEMVALVGAHTIGFSHCSEFSNRLFNFSKTSDYDPTYNPKFAQGLRQLCANYKTDPGMSGFNDVITPGKFDNMYYINLKRGLGLLASDQALVDGERTRPFVDLYAENQTAFFEAFGHAMEKVSVYNIKTGKQGEVRRKCDAFNSIKTGLID